MIEQYSGGYSAQIIDQFKQRTFSLFMDKPIQFPFTCPPPIVAVSRMCLILLLIFA